MSSTSPSKPLERRVSSEIVFSCPIFDVERAVVELPGGRREDRWYVVKPDAVVIVGLDAQGRFLLTHEFRSAAGRVVWTLPSGKVQQGEDPEVAAHRELREETGLDGSMELLSSEPQASASTRQTVHLFLARDLVAAPLSTGDEVEGQITVQPLPQDEAEALMLRGELDGKYARAIRLALDRLRVRVS